MADAVAALIFAGVAVLLTASTLQQFRQLGPRGQWLDTLALLPQWKFFAQAAVAQDPAWSDDWHLLARIAETGSAGQAGAWQPVLWPEDRRWWQAIWNPHERSRAHLLAYAERLSQADAAELVDPTGLAYLTVLRACFRAVALSDGHMLQFAVVATRGREARAVRLRFLSLWHIG